MRPPQPINRTIHTFEGRPITVREIATTDWRALQQFHRTLSADTIFRRHFGFQPELTDARAHYFCDVDGKDRFALVAEDPREPGEIIGVVRFDRDRPGGHDAEYAAVVTDRWHGQGIGIGLTCMLIEAARERGITNLYAIVQPDNWKMMSLFRNLGLPERITFEDDVERIELSIEESVMGVCRPQEGVFAMRVLVAVASKHGSTTEIGEEIAGRLRSSGHDVQFADIEHVPDVAAYDAFVLGSAVYMGHWMKTVPQFVDRHAEEIAERPTWLFSSGPIGHEAPPEVGTAQETEPLIARTQARDYASFAGRVEPAELGFMERLAVRAVHAPAGDYRDWEAIRAWADRIARELTQLQASPSGGTTDER